MPTTRSASKSKQTSLDNDKERDTLQPKTQPKKTLGKTKAVKEDSKAEPKANTSKKRKAPASEHEDDKTKKTPRSDKKPTKQAELSEDASELAKPIMINRSPVLQLWASVVAAFLYPDESWDTCLSIGSSISTLCAISKGKAIGQIEPKDRSVEEEDKRKKRKKEVKKETREIEVMGFPLHIKNNVVVLDGKEKPVKEGLLKGKYGGDDTFTKVKQVMEDALRSWDDNKDELDRKAFHMYEKFRPNVATGQSGWGRKGELNLHEVKSAIER
ncbi:hypothetical protein H2198_000700 [Neophaeococcomyces mojaviensis]|uniref:Uncharacterized protein n=1 Tax=Neophaeococcomyces mojaviensis TaxID=3383035 RepID=A0ACC3AJ25_9EURO|nr:hypothetical protein H2198_000700 [Knufia sp. JES_112]